MLENSQQVTLLLITNVDMDYLGGIWDYLHFSKHGKRKEKKCTQDIFDCSLSFFKHLFFKKWLAAWLAPHGPLDNTFQLEESTFRHGK